MPKLSRRSTRWSWTTGEKGLNRVRVFTHPKSGRLYLEWHEPVAGDRPRVRTKALGHTNRDDAKRAAEDLAAQLRLHGVLAVPTGTLTFGTLFEMFEEAMQQVGRLRTAHTAAGKRLVACFGAQAAVMALDEHDVERYVHARRTGRLRLA